MTAAISRLRDGVAAAGRRIALGPPGTVVDVAIPLLASPLLLFPRGFLPIAGLAAIAGLWVARWIVWRTPLPANPLGLPMLLILVMAAQSLYPSVDLSLSLPKLYGIVLGVAIYFGVANGVRSPRWWWAAVAAMMISAVGVAGVGLVSTSWLDKLPGSAAVYSRIPHLISSIPSSFGTIAGIHPNELGGTLAFLLPIPLGVLLWSIGRCRGGSGPAPTTVGVTDRAAGHRALPYVAVASLLTAGPVLALTYSRSSLIGFAAAVVVLLAVRWRRFGYLLAGLLVVGAIAFAAIGPQRVYDRVVQLDQGSQNGGSSLVSRPEVWNRASYMIQDFPFTGIGLNTFPIVLDNLYPSFLAGPDARIPHAHNIYLQTAVDLGLAGLMAFVGLWLIVAREAAQAFRRARDGPMRGAIAGLAAGCLAYLVYGLTDAITLGAKPLVLLWAMVGLIVVANRELATTTSSLEREEGENSICGDTPHPARRGPAAPSGLPRLLREAWQTLAWLYWVIAILFAAMAYLVVILAATGWTP